MSEIVHVNKSRVIGVIFIGIAFIISLVIGYGLLKDGQKKENCWDNYTTEQEAILNCEGVNE